MLKQSGSGRQRSKEGFRFHLVIKTGLAMAVTIWLLYQLKHLLNHHEQTTSQAAAVGETALGLESRMAMSTGGALKFGRKGLISTDGEKEGKIENTNGAEVKEERGDENSIDQQKQQQEEDEEGVELERIEELVDGEDKVDVDVEEEDDGNEEERAIEQLDFQADEEVDTDFLDRASE